MSVSPQIHPTAVIDPRAEIWPDVTVGPYAVIEGPAVIGKGCKIDAMASIKAYTRMGENNHIHSYACVGCEPQDLKFHGEESWLELGNGNNIREFSTLSRGTANGGALTKIGDNNLLMAYTHVAHDCKLGNSIVMSNCATLAGHVEVGDFVIISGLSAVHQFVRIGAHAFIGGKTGIGQDLPPYMLAIGTRGWVHSPNLVGLKRMNASLELVGAIKNAFRLLWRSELSRSEALEKIAADYGQFAEIQTMLDFINKSERGILTGVENKHDD